MIMQLPQISPTLDDGALSKKNFQQSCDVIVTMKIVITVFLLISRSLIVNVIVLTQLTIELICTRNHRRPRRKRKQQICDRYHERFKYL